MKRTLATIILAACAAVLAETAEEDVSPDTTTNDVIVIDVPAVTNAVVVAATNNPVVKVGWQVPDSSSCYWFLRMTVYPDAMKCTKDEFCKALVAEGLPVNPSYRHIQ